MTKFIVSQDNIKYYSKNYEENAAGKQDEIIENELRDWFRKNKFLDRKHFLQLCLWKSKRPRKFYQDEINSNERIKFITNLAISSGDEYFKIKSLQLLNGVSWPVASVILHFAQPNKYMIMDFRAIWALGWKQPKQYTFEFWEKYTQEVNKIAYKLNISLRTLDKALWQYSKENQK